MLDQALQRTRDPVTGMLNRAKAAALLKGKLKCSTNEFDRWGRGLWLELSIESQETVTALFPELAGMLKALDLKVSK